MTQVTLAGVTLSPFTLSEAVADIIDRALTKQPTSVHLCTSHTLGLCYSDPDYARVLADGDVNLADGTPPALLLRKTNRDLTPSNRPRGTDLLRSTLVAGQPHGIRHFFLGADQQTLALMGAWCEEHIPGALICGTHPPPFREISRASVIEDLEQVRPASPHIVWVGLGTPKQDQFLEFAKREYSAVYVAVGAAFDFLGGSKREAPVWAQRFGCEWLYRWASEPRRLTRRYTKDLWAFCVGVIADRRKAARSL